MESINKAAEIISVSVLNSRLHLFGKNNITKPVITGSKTGISRILSNL
jgi:hypothetical protein